MISDRHGLCFASIVRILDEEDIAVYCRTREHIASEIEELERIVIHEV